MTAQAARIQVSGRYPSTGVACRSHGCELHPSRVAGNRDHPYSRLERAVKEIMREAETLRAEHAYGGLRSQCLSPRGCTVDVRSNRVLSNL